jgi:hypothetical protein
MNEQQRDQYLGVDPTEVLAHLEAKGLPCVIRVAEHFTISGDFTDVELDAALADFVPSTAEDRALDAHIASTGLNMTRDQYNAVRAQMQTLRDLRQLGRNAFMALTAAERDRLTYDAMTSVTIVLLAILRDE